MSEPRQSFETVAGCKVNVRRAGKGEPLLFLHGAQGAPLWLPFMAALARRFEVIVPEHPGFGLSDTLDWLDNIADLAFFYLDFMEALGLERVNLVGASLGGWIAAEVAVRDQHPLKTLTLAAPSGIHVKGLQPADLFMWSREQAIRNLVADQELAEKMLSQPQSDGQIDLMLKNNFTTAKLAWQPRFYDFNVYTERKRAEKLRYMHRNPVKRELVQEPEQWLWSSFRHYKYGAAGLVRVNDCDLMQMSVRRQAV